MEYEIAYVFTKNVFEMVTSDGTYYIIGERDPRTDDFLHYSIENSDRVPIVGATFDLLMEKFHSEERFD
jgi:hypothetical protein|tara:strand:+ start:1217 stop:1423 length:207 start_codon:yes stop_codon:yes gene_type:complete